MSWLHLIMYICNSAERLKQAAPLSTKIVNATENDKVFLMYVSTGMQKAFPEIMFQRESSIQFQGAGSSPWESFAISSSLDKLYLACQRKEDKDHGASSKFFTRILCPGVWIYKRVHFWAISLQNICSRTEQQWQSWGSRKTLLFSPFALKNKKRFVNTLSWQGCIETGTLAHC